jgi:hypothetical protein
MSGFTKLVPEIVMSSIWNESPEVRSKNALDRCLEL